MPKRNLGDALRDRLEASPHDFEAATYEKIFGKPTTSPPKGLTIYRKLPLDKLVSFFTYQIGFHLLTEQALELFADSLVTDGLLEPIIVRPVPGQDCYEILSGHNRVAAYRLKGIPDIMAEIVECSDERALNIATATNLQRRKDYSPLELGTAWRALVEAKAHQGYRSDLVHTSVHNEQGSAEASEVIMEHARVEVANAYGISPATVWRYTRLTHLLPELAELVEKKKLAVVAGAIISEYDAQTQAEFLALWKNNGRKLQQEVVILIKDRCPVPTIAPLALENAYQEVRAQMASKPKGRTISFRRKPFEAYLSKLDDEQKLEELFLQFLKERVG